MTAVCDVDGFVTARSPQRRRANDPQIAALDQFRAHLISEEGVFKIALL
jgi:hypothetical protein